MFETLTERLGQTFRHMMGRGKLTEGNIQATLTELEHAFIEADVALEVRDAFLEALQKKLVGMEITPQFTPAQRVIQCVRDQLVSLLGDTETPTEWAKQPPVVILLVGLQGAGKTTTAAKLGKFLKDHTKKSVLLASVDVYRPAAVAQLRVQAEGAGVAFFEDPSLREPLSIAQAAMDTARKQARDVLIVDTAGRLHIDEKMMGEVIALHACLDPVETLFVVDGMMGQDAVRSAKVFHEALPLTGNIVTKLDGDARGGAILSVRHITGKPIRWIGVGEKVDALERFYPDRMASRILGMGDLLSLIEELERKGENQSAQQLVEKMRKGQAFDLEDFREQLVQMRQMGGMSQLIDKLPGASSLPPGVRQQVLSDKTIARTLAIINSMTAKERRRPMLIQGRRKSRIAMGSGTSIPLVNQVLKQFHQMEKMMGKFLKGKRMPWFSHFKNKSLSTLWGEEK